MTRSKVAALFAPLVAVALLLASCQSGWKQTSDRFLHAFKAVNAAQMLDVANSIGARQIQSRDGFKFLKLKVSAYQLAGKYSESFVTMRRYRQDFPSRIDLLIAMGRTAFWLGLKYKRYFKDAHQLLQATPLQKMNEIQLGNEYYLSLVLKLRLAHGLIPIMQKTFDKKVLPTILRWNSLSESQLMTDGPTGFVIPPKNDFAAMLGKKNGGIPATRKD